MRIILLTLFATLLLFTKITAQTATLTGAVIDAETRDSLGFVPIKILHSDTVFAETTTDISGNFEVKKLPSGSVNVSVSYVGYHSKIWKEVRLDSNKTTTIDLLLYAGHFKEPKIEWRHFSFTDSFGHFVCIDALTANKKDKLGRKQGLWQERFMEDEYENSLYRFGQIICEGNYLNNKKKGEWKYYKKDGTIEKIIIYKNGKQVKTSK